MVATSYHQASSYNGRGEEQEEIAASPIDIPEVGGPRLRDRAMHACQGAVAKHLREVEVASAPYDSNINIWQWKCTPAS